MEIWNRACTSINIWSRRSTSRFNYSAFFTSPIFSVLLSHPKGTPLISVSLLASSSSSSPHSSASVQAVNPPIPLQPMHNSSSQHHASSVGHPSQQTQQGADINSSSPNPLHAATVASPSNAGSSCGVPLPISHVASRPPLSQSSGSNTQSQQQQDLPSDTAHFSLNISRYSDLLKGLMNHPFTQILAVTALVLGLYLDTRANELSKSAIRLAKEAIHSALEETCRNHPVSPLPILCRMNAVNNV